MPFVFAPPPQAVLPVQDEKNEYFPIHRVYGLGKNYAEPGAEKPQPFYFLKPEDGVVPVAEGATAKIPVPQGLDCIYFEMELVAAIGRGGRNLTLEQAADAVWGWAAGIDFTIRRKLADGRPDLYCCKAIDRGSPMSWVRPAYRCPMPDPADIWLYANDRKVQAGTTAGLVVKPLEAIVEISKFWELCPGDLIFLGTPSGSAGVRPGDKLYGGVNGVGTLRVEIV